MTFKRGWKAGLTSNPYLVPREVRSPTLSLMQRWRPRARNHAESKTYKKRSISTGSTKQILDPLNHLDHRLPLEYDLLFSSLGNLSNSRPCLEPLLPLPSRRLSMLNIRCQMPCRQSSTLSWPSSSARKDIIGAALSGMSREEVSNSEVRIIVPRS